MGLASEGSVVVSVEEYHPDGFYYGADVEVEWDEETGYIGGEIVGRMYANGSLSEREVEILEENLIDLAIDEVRG